MLGVHYEYFAQLSMSQILHSLALGIRFDLSIGTLLYAPFLIILLISQCFSFHVKVVRFVLWGAFFLQAILWLLCLANIAYFGEVYRPLGNEVLLLVNDVDFLLALASGSRLLALLMAIGLVVCLAIAWKKVVVKHALNVRLEGQYVSRGINAFVIVLLAFICIRGFEFSSRPLSISDAYSLGSEVQAALMMNGSFSVVHNTRRALKEKRNDIHYLSEEELKFMSNEWEALSFTRAIPKYYSTPRNVVFILLESWSYQYIDGLSGTQYGATPFMDTLIKDSRVWTNAYAAGQRSIEGMQAVLTSVPLLEGQDVIGFGLEQNRLTKIGTEAQQEGYNTVFMQTSKRRSFQVNAVAGALGFEHYFGLEDFPKSRDYPDDSRFGWDYEGLMFFADYLNTPKNVEAPFFGFFFTGTTHEPFPDPGSDFHIYPHNEDWQNRYLNTLKYSDWALEQFMNKMKAHPNYLNTTFVFMADHVLRASMKSRYATFHIPLMIYTPDGSVPAKFTSEYVSQYDLLPTLSSLLGINQEISTFGRSLLTEEYLASDGVFSKQGGIGVWLEPNSWFTFNTESGADLEFSHQNEAALYSSKMIKLKLQKASQLLKVNQWGK